MNSPIQQHLQQQGFLILDGALATELEQLGADLDDPLWSAKCLLESPELIARVHQDYLEAGADIISSATYQASERGFRQRGLAAKESRALMREGVALAVRERDAFWTESTQAKSAGNSQLKPLVAASMGPFGACLFDGSEYHGNYLASWKEVSVFHRERMLVLAEAGADLLAFETIPSLAEAEILLELLEKHVPDLHDLKAWISFSCKDDTHVSHGESFNECIAIAAKSDHVASGGINCTPPGLVLELLQSLDSTELPLMVYPNSGETWEPETNCWLGEGSAYFDVAGWYGAGTRIFGGCCRTRPADITGIRAGLKAHMNQGA